MTRLRATVVCLLTLYSISAASQQKAPETPAPSASSASSLRREFHAKTSHAYYRLAEHGFQGLHCSAAPDWDELYQKVKTDAYLMQELKPALKQTQFQVVLGADGASAVSHQLGELPVSLATTERLRATADGLDNILGGALQSWTALSNLTMLPAAGDESYEIEWSDGKYRLHSRDENSEMRLTADAEGRVERVEESNPRYTVVLLPRWEQTPEGLILAGYEATLTADGSTVQTMRVGFAYIELHGMRVPQLITLWLETPQGSLRGPIALANYEFLEK